MIEYKHRAAHNGPNRPHANTHAEGLSRRPASHRAHCQTMKAVRPNNACATKPADTICQKMICDMEAV